MFEVVCKRCGSVDVSLEVREYSHAEHIWGTCNDCSNKAALNQRQKPEFFTMPFGKHKGKSVMMIIEEDRQYAEWVVNKSDLKQNIKSKFQEGLNF